MTQASLTFQHTYKSIMNVWCSILRVAIVLLTLLVMPLMSEMPQPLPRVNLIHPICTQQAGKRYKFDKHVSIQVKSIRSHPPCPCAIDVNGKCRFAEHMCFGANTTFLCTLHMKDLTITSWGALIEGDRKSRDVISLGDNSFAGGHAPQYWPEANAVIYRGIELALQRFKPVNSVIPTKDVVIPTRMRWDDCFNHLSFQSLPLIGLVYEHQPQLFYTSYWHASRFTAAILLLLGVEYQRLVIETHVTATTAVLPWIPHWSPFDTAPIRGVARNVSILATQNLLSRKITLAKNSAVFTLTPMNYLYEPTSLDFNEKERYVVYFNRSSGGKRTVDNEGEILATIHNMLLPSYRLVVLPPVKEYKKIHQIHAVWQQYARIVNRAVLLIGPHGK